MWCRMEVAHSGLGLRRSRGHKQADGPDLHVTYSFALMSFSWLTSVAIKGISYDHDGGETRAWLTDRLPGRTDTDENGLLLYYTQPPLRPWKTLVMELLHWAELCASTASVLSFCVEREVAQGKNIHGLRGSDKWLSWFLIGIEPMGLVIKCEDFYITYKHTARTTVAEVLKKQTDGITWPVSISLCPWLP